MRPLLATLLLLGCASSPPARPVAHSTPAPRPPVTAVASPPETPDPLFARFSLQCRDPLAPCPASVGMILWREGDEVQRCTVALVDTDRVMTASHCLPPRARAPGASCAGAWVTFPRTRERPMEWAACGIVLRADGVRDDQVLRRDVALVRLGRAVERPTIEVDGSPPEEGSVVTVLSTRPHPIYPAYNEVVPRLCRVATRRSAVETFGPRADRVGWLMECPSQPGNSGSPVLDARGRIRSLVHAGSAPVDGVAVMSPLN